MECLPNPSIGLALILSITDSLSVMEGTPKPWGPLPLHLLSHPVLLCTVGSD